MRKIMKIDITLLTKLERIKGKTDYIINSSGITNTLQSDYDSIKDEWKSLKDKIEDYKDIQFTNKDFQSDEYDTIFSAVCKTNMQKIKSICEDNIAKINDEIKKEQEELDNKRFKKDDFPKLKFIITVITLVLTINGLVLVIICQHFSNQNEIRFYQGKDEMRQELTKEINELKDTISVLQQQNYILSDTLNYYKLKVKDYEKITNKSKRPSK